MPLDISPVDHKTPMQKIVKNGIEIDRCPLSGGVWLDAGELEKLLSMVQSVAHADREEYHQYRQAHPAYRPPVVEAIPAYHKGQPRYHDDYDDYHYKKHKKKSRWTEVFDIFD